MFLDAFGDVVASLADKHRVPRDLLMELIVLACAAPNPASAGSEGDFAGQVAEILARWEGAESSDAER